MPQPVTVLLRQSLMLKAAIAACRNKPTPKAVHRLRSTTRRIEATLELLAISTGIPHIRKEFKPFRRSLRKIRRTAGSVRDLDVHRELLVSHGRNSDTTLLDKNLVAARKKTANKLQKRLTDDRDKIQNALDNLKTVLKPALHLNLSGGSLIGITRQWLSTALRDINPEQERQLHALRKSCKTARYLAEIGAPASKAAARLAKRLEGVQQALGAWHDHLLLLSEAQASLPESSQTSKKIQTHTNHLRRRADSVAKRLLATI
jgi:CHAD domain-containing protein